MEKFLLKRWLIRRTKKFHFDFRYLTINMMKVEEVLYESNIWFKFRTPRKFSVTKKPQAKNLKVSTIFNAFLKQYFILIFPMQGPKALATDAMSVYVHFIFSNQCQVRNPK